MKFGACVSQKRTCVSLGNIARAGRCKKGMLVNAMSRREFVVRAAIGCGAAGSLAWSETSLVANPLHLPIGSQVWPLRSMLKDFPGFAQKIAGIGVTRLELCSPIGYGTAFSSLANGKEVSKILADHGLKCESSHFTMGELRHSQEQSIEWAKEIGITQMITASLGDGNGGSHPTLDQVKKAADEYNRIAAVAAHVGARLRRNRDALLSPGVPGPPAADVRLAAAQAAGGPYEQLHVLDRQELLMPRTGTYASSRVVLGRRRTPKRRRGTASERKGSR